MICFPNAKINIGLRILEKRPDNYHSIETLFYPIGLKDILESVPVLDKNTFANIQLSGLPVDGDAQDNLVMKAYRLLQKDFQLKPLSVLLHKSIPAGSGLGGGSSDAAFMLRLLNTIQDLGLSHKQLESYAAQLGADCAFFIHNLPLLAYDKGDRFETVDFSLKGCFLVLLIPKNIQISTAEAYAHIRPAKPGMALKDCIACPPETWKKCLINDFEPYVFDRYPELTRIKQSLYDAGAFYASMSGSGSSLFGLFETACDLKASFPDYYYWSENL